MGNISIKIINKIIMRLIIQIRLRTRIKDLSYKIKLNKIHKRIGVAIDKDNSISKQKSKIHIDVFIPAIPRELETLQFVVDSIKENILHPVDNIFIIGPTCEELFNLCNKKKCTFVDEKRLLPFDKDKIRYKPKNLDRSGWIYQQLLKLNCDIICKNEHILIADADTIFIRPQSFEHEGKIIFDVSSELHFPYYEIYNRLLKRDPDYFISFVAHHMLLQKSKLISIKKNLEDIHKVKWFDAILNHIDKNEISSFSEYELYGHYMLSNFKEEMILEYWKNVIHKRKYLLKTKSKIDFLSQKYKSITFPYYYY